MEAQIGMEIDAIMAQRNAIRAAVQSLSDRRYREVLNLNYLGGLPIHKVAEKLHYEEKYTYKLRRKGVKALPLEEYLPGE